MVGLCVRLFCNIIGLFCHMCGVYVCRLTADVYVSIRKSYMCSSPHLFGICLMYILYVPHLFALPVCLTCLPYMSALYVCLICLSHSHALYACLRDIFLYACLICMPYFYVLHIYLICACLCRLVSRHEVLAAALGITLSFIVCFDGASSWDSQIACDQQVYYLYYRAGIMFGVWAPFGIREVRR